MRQWAGLKYADYGLQIEKDSRRQDLVERLIRKTQDGTLGQPTGEPLLGDDMGVTVGDTISNHYHQESRGIGLAGKIALSVALLAAGAGAGAVIPALLADKAETPPTIETTDTDTRYGIRLFRPNE